MNKTIKKVLAILLSAIFTLGSFGSLAVFAGDNEAQTTADWVLADFSDPAKSGDIVNWGGDNGYTINSGSYYHQLSEITSEVSRDGGTSFKLDHRYGKKDHDNSIGVYNTRLTSREYSGEDGNLEKVLSYDYLYLWIYSEKANNQKTNIILFDQTTGKYQHRSICHDYTGWKLHKWNISSWSLASFNNGTDKVAAGTDKVCLWISSSFGVSAEDQLKDTVLYFDSIYFSNRDEFAVNVEKDWTADDYLIADFSVENSGVTTVGRAGQRNTEVTREGRAYSLKSAATMSGDSRVEVRSDNYVLGDILEKDNMYMWLYSEKANDQVLSVIFFDWTTSKYVYKKVTLDWTGWKLVKIGKTDWNESYQLSSFNDAGKEKIAENTDNARFWISYNWGSTEVKSDTVFYIDSIWFSDRDIDNNSEIDVLKNFNNDEALVRGTFTSKGGTATNKASVTTKPYGTNAYSAEVIPSESDYNYATTYLLVNEGRTVASDYNLKGKYINIIMYSDAANHQKFRINFDGFNTSKKGELSGGIRVVKQNIDVDWTGWKVLSYPLSSFIKQDANYTGATGTTEDALNNMETLSEVNLHFPDWGNGREWDKTIGDSGAWSWENIGNSVLSDTKLYIDSVFLTDSDMSAVVLTPSEANELNVSAETAHTVTFEAPIDFFIGNGFYDNSVEVIKNQTALDAADYTISVEGNKLCVTVKNPETASEYTVKVKENTFLTKGQTSQAYTASFTTETVDEEESGVISFSAASAADQSLVPVTAIPSAFAALSARVLFKNEATAPVNAALVIGIYKDNALVATVNGANAEVGAGEKVRLSAAVYGAAENGAYGTFEGCTAKAFVWDITSGSLKPYLNFKGLN